jgi:nucleoside-diphosphate-sugar epimerase
MKKILITGGSGFIGTNLIEKLLATPAVDFINIDISKPKIANHESYWKKIDITDKNALQKELDNFNPHIVIHLAARTDLNGKSIEDYNANTVGVENLVEILDAINSVEQVIFTSSMYVCKPGYPPKTGDDYAPHTIYGESKVITEKVIKSNNPTKYTWCIVRPTSIWGPWFGEPYANFFHVVMGHKYFHMGEKACTKTYGYIDNTIYQIMSILDAPREQVHKKTFYLGDWPAYNISEWADEIAEYLGFKIPKIPFTAFRLLAITGDLLKFIRIKFPMTSFRLKNMTTDNILDLTPIKEIAPNLPVSRKQGVKNTITWIQKKSS